jgi:diguanylate cyclase (GGDEF)-like protein/PAS domain S-box-containing protein
MIKHKLKPMRSIARAKSRVTRRAIRRSSGKNREEEASDNTLPEVIPAAETRPTAPFEWLAAFDELADPVFIHDKDFRILRCNSAYAMRAGLPLEAIIGKPYWQVFPKLGGPLGNCVEALRRGATAQQSELTAAVGEIFLSHDITAHHRSGEFWYSRHLMENITARMLDSDSSKMRSLLSEAIVRGLPGILAVVDNQYRLIRWSADLQALSGRTAARLQDADIRSLVVDTDRAAFVAKLDEAFASQRTEGILRLLDGSGDAEDIAFYAQAVEVGGAQYVVCIGLSKSLVRRLESNLAVEKAFSDTILESAPGPYYVVDQQARLVRWNHHLREVTGLGDAELFGRSVLDAIYEPDRPLASAKFLAALAMGHSQMEVRMPTATRGIRMFLKTARRIDRAGEPFVTGFCVDITERREEEDALRQQKALSEAIVNSVPGAFYVVDEEGSYIAWNSYLNRLTGLTDAELRKRSSLLTIEENDRPLAAAAMKEAFESGYGQVELHVHTKDRGPRLYFMAARRFSVAHANYLVGMGFDTTDRGKRIRELEEEARTDPLTHVSNRQHFLSLASQEFARSRRYGHPLSLWMIDVDHFKSVNDTYGHHAGDIALQTLGSVSRQTLRDWDVMGRMGGEEFAVLLPETDSTQALLVAERLRQKISATEVPVEAGATTHMTISIGVATLREDDNDLERLIDRADQALLDAKRTGRDKVCVADQLTQA